MTLKSKYKPTDAELEILRVLWKEGGSTVRIINEILNAKREVGYTTTLKFLQIMEQKGMVKVDRSSRTHLYSALIREDETQKHLLDQLLQSAFGGSAKKLVMQALGNNKTSQKELEDIKNLIKQLEGGKQ
ncbi:MAG: BlaI/MecI/CopY family transcriptional regulator [Bacteroidales bacterium]|jgi:predicted transcriptional regulator|nr:BlaI/MecI/CopY family transcriptional regulator [Bacteroidales bacterium]